METDNYVILVNHDPKKLTEITEELDKRYTLISGLTIENVKKYLAKGKVMIWHPGLKHQSEIKDVLETYPNLHIAVTATTPWDYHMDEKYNIPIINCTNLSGLCKFIDEYLR